VTERDRVRATAWVQQALRAGRVRFYDGDQEFPKPAEEDECFEIFGTLD
jgi:hypothetical protein